MFKICGFGDMHEGIPLAEVGKDCIGRVYQHVQNPLKRAKIAMIVMFICFLLSGLCLLLAAMGSGGYFIDSLADFTHFITAPGIMGLTIAGGVFEFLVLGAFTWKVVEGVKVLKKVDERLGATLITKGQKDKMGETRRILREAIILDS